MPDPNLNPETDPTKPEVQPAQPTPEPAAPAVDYAEKFAQSTRENQLLREELAQEKKAREELTNQPTDSELKAAFPTWDTMSDTEKDLARYSFGASRNAANATRIAQQQQLDRERANSIEIAITSDPALQGKEQAFRQFASKPQYANVPMDLLIGAFLQKNGGTPPAPTPTPKPGLEPGNGGPKEAPKPKTLSAEELGSLRKSDPKAYEAYVKTHDIDVDLG